MIAPSMRAADPQNLEKIRQESLRQPDDPLGRPLPLASHWHTGTTTDGYGPRKQIELLKQGHFILPWLLLPPLEETLPALDDEEILIKLCAKHHLPLCVLSSQWERLLSNDPAYDGLPADQNPNVVEVDGKIQRKVSPFGPVDPWRTLGRRWGEHPLLRQMEQWYPDPPFVLMVSNNEQPKLRWHEVETSKRYLDRYGPGKPDDFKRTVVAEGWRIRYGALIGGFREGLTPRWRSCTQFVGYNAFASPSIGRWPGWPQHSLHYKDRLSVWPEIWNGASVPFYTHPWDASADNQVWSPQTEAMNWAAAQALLPNDRSFWLELSTWDGHEPGKPNDKRQWYANKGEHYSPARYAGMVQYGMWLLRPRTVREFRPHVETLASMQPYFAEVLAAVDRIHQNPTLREFWRKGELVPNRSRLHPYQQNLPTVLQTIDRWYRLDTSLDPSGPWKLDTRLDVFAVALSLDTASKRRFMVYAHAPNGPKAQVTVHIPESGDVTVDVPVEGGFWLFDGSTKEAIVP
jgi:hypothetical protein